MSRSDVCTVAMRHWGRIDHSLAEEQMQRELGFESLTWEESASLSGGDAGAAVALGIAIAGVAWAAFEIGRTKLGPWICANLLPHHHHRGED